VETRVAPTYRVLPPRRPRRGLARARDGVGAGRRDLGGAGGAQRRVHLREQRLHRLAQLHELRVDLAGEEGVGLARLLRGARLGARDHVGEGGELVVELDRVVERVLAALVAHLVELRLDGADALEQRARRRGTARRCSASSLASRVASCPRTLRTIFTASLASVTLSRICVSSANCAA
jgi:hypothetical protein